MAFSKDIRSKRLAIFAWVGIESRETGCTVHTLPANVSLESCDAAPLADQSLESARVWCTPIGGHNSFGKRHNPMPGCQAHPSIVPSPAANRYELSVGSPERYEG